VIDCYGAGACDGNAGEGCQWCSSGDGERTAERNCSSVCWVEVATDECDCSGHGKVVEGGVFPSQRLRRPVEYPFTAVVCPRHLILIIEVATTRYYCIAAVNFANAVERGVAGDRVGIAGIGKVKFAVVRA
jgi:hypothetical protein